MSEKMLIINDPIHGIMEFLDNEKYSIRKIIDHPLFQRLRYIKQLGMADLVFPGAVHTRFNHSLGASYLASQIIKNVTTNMAPKVTPNNHFEECHWHATIYALLHDVGHGPFSHAFERLSMNEKSNGITHEDWLPYFLQEIANDQNPFLQDVLQKIMDPKNTFSKNVDSENTFSANAYLIKDVVSSQLDADRLDYLLRDSHFCGVSYGKYDLNWLLHCMQAVKDKENNLRLGIAIKGVGAVEGFLMARRLMTRNIYQHTSITLLQMLMMAFLSECCNAIYENSLQELCPIYLKIFLSGLWDYQQGRIDKKKFMQSYFDAYKLLNDHIIYQWIETVIYHQDKLPQNIVALGKRLYYRDCPKVFTVSKDLNEILLEMIEKLRSMHDFCHWQIGLQQENVTTYQDLLEPIWVQDKEVIEISQSSFFMNAMANQKESLSFLYIDKSLLTHSSLGPILKFIEAVK